MLVIHPNDNSTRIAQAIYAGMNVHTVDDAWYERGIGQLLWQTPKEEPILMIGYGDCYGLYANRYSERLELNPSMLDDPMYLRRIAACMDVPHYVLRKLHGYNLRKHNGNLIGIWPGAVEFARRNRLHGLFTDKFIYNWQDAELYGKMTLDMHINKANLILFRTLGRLISSHVPFYKIPEAMKKCGKERRYVVQRNFDSFFCL